MRHELFLLLHQFVSQNNMHCYIFQEFFYNYDKKPLLYPILSMLDYHNFSILLIRNLFWELELIVRGLPSLVKGVRFRSLSLRSSWGQIPLPARKIKILLGTTLKHCSFDYLHGKSNQNKW